ncbi:guanine nucleotide-binding protein subunit gamma 3-like isoform X1 [Phoenix dactylifera]|uniref:Guanine nucleotide-binding protein subunit gamma 3-like isoform X1 n=1 Tax=Phoenix dactylifera TaxID=42345 RepID=A0A8B9AII8_PHODC|nr:guanine nucleotide-binding protein subunit gamma 3-like isoform X1 [Phoenix dactylifera]
MEAAAAAGSEAPPPPAPRSPPGYPDLCGRHRLQVEVQILNWEIGFLGQEELESLEGLQSVSGYCKEVNEYVGSHADPLVPLTKKRRKSCRIWRWLWAKLCFNMSWICCFCGCPCPQRRPICTCRHVKNCCCRCRHCGCPNKNCWKASCCRPCCSLRSLSCPECSCGCVWSCSKFTETCSCLKCSSTCCMSRCLCE